MHTVAGRLSTHAHGGRTSVYPCTRWKDVCLPMHTVAGSLPMHTVEGVCPYTRWKDTVYHTLAHRHGLLNRPLTFNKLVFRDLRGTIRGRAPTCGVSPSGGSATTHGNSCGTQETVEDTCKARESVSIAIIN